MTPEYRHIPVMLNEVLASYAFTDGSIVCDCTLGGAGHSLKIAQLIEPHGILFGIDQDDLALEVASQRIHEAYPNLLSFQMKGNFNDLESLLMQKDVAGVDFFLFDIGVSSPQFDIPERGFSYRENAPLDMRMNPGKQTLTAQEILNTYNAADLTRVIRTYGEDKFAAKIASLVVKQREIEPIKTTFELVDIIKAAIPARARRSGGHPAKKTFQALRIEVNQELSALEEGLRQAIRWLNPGGRVCVISYHSLEDRIVKRIFQEYADRNQIPANMPLPNDLKPPIVKVITKKPLVPRNEELEENPRAKSAKLRVAEKLPLK
ncbi:MAG: 16S rRNA (cytosine(1402)-N(4))-methyltransferase RsmH [Coriobacteriia bacterium]|nr:16S rRNA (cytosine(1402)-N(4))-methyltransferase RsmH [Coriobacteriia bacterium]